MKILAIETSCDETAVAILEIIPATKGRVGGSKRDPQFRVLSNIISSQIKLHTNFGGVVPNLARREHEKNLVPITIQAFKESKLHKRAPNNTELARQQEKVATILEREQDLLRHFKKSITPLAIPDIDAIAVTHGPGLAPALWVGVNFARALSCVWNKPLMPINHMAGHFYSALIEYDSLKLKQTHFKKIKFPALALLVSGAHTELVLVSGHGKFRILGQTLDDAAGEAFDKVGRMLGFGYPGGPAISAAAETSHFSAKGRSASGGQFPIKFPRPIINSKDYDFSFSGLKTSVLYFIRDIKKPQSVHKLQSAIAREFQNAVVDVLVAKTICAAQEYNVKTVTLGGGVAANALLRQRLAEELNQKLPRVQFITPEISMTGDNALMIALAAYFCGKKKAQTQVRADANLQF